jgi:uncharacterized protein YbjQ (UPF0145 family)
VLGKRAVGLATEAARHVEGEAGPDLVAGRRRGREGHDPRRVVARPRRALERHRAIHADAQRALARLRDDARALVAAVVGVPLDELERARGAVTCADHDVVQQRVERREVEQVDAALESLRDVVGSSGEVEPVAEPEAVKRAEPVAIEGEDAGVLVDRLDVLRDIELEPR